MQILFALAGARLFSWTFNQS